ncbi:type II toxin-antitoxin system death-on-curing family toxin [Streptomyces sp. NPDC057430]|uniref:type II toxin-antitoxin system death-on-curing family toxin n=1 Tax=Streptomyces sp. NPDC057430 TaxID=3346131 RepID=UPI003673C953
MTHVYLSGEDLLGIAEEACGRKPFVQDVGLVATAAHRAASGGDAYYPGTTDKAAALLQSLAFTRPFADGNKRTAWLACVTFLSLNGVELRPDADAAAHLVSAVTAGDLDDVEAISGALRELLLPDVS